MIQDGYSLVLHDQKDAELELRFERQQSIQTQPHQLATLLRLWERSRAEFLTWILNRKGASKDQARQNTRKAYHIALEQFFGGIQANLHVQHEEELLARGEYASVIWPELTPWNVTSTTARQFKDILAMYGRGIRGRYTLATGKMVRSEVGRTGLSSASINVKLAGLKSYYDFLVRLFEVPYRPSDHKALLDAGLLFPDETGRKVLLWSPNWRNPFDPKVVTPFNAKKKPVFLTTEEVKRILAQINTNCATGIRDYALLLTIWSTACRANEVLSLCWGDLKQKANGNYLFAFRGKSGKHEEVELQAEVYQVICRYLRVVGRFEEMESSSPIFTAIDQDRILRIDSIRQMYPNGVPVQPISQTTASQMFKKYALMAEVPAVKAHLHALRHGRARHTVLSMKARHGVADITEVNKLLRHSSLDMTQHYTDMMDEAEDKWASDAINAVIGGRKGKRRPGGNQQAELPGVVTPEMENELLRAKIAELQKKLDESGK